MIIIEQTETICSFEARSVEHSHLKESPAVRLRHYFVTAQIDCAFKENRIESETEWNFQVVKKDRNNCHSPVVVRHSLGWMNDISTNRILKFESWKSINLKSWCSLFECNSVLILILLFVFGSLNSHFEIEDIEVDLPKRWLISDLSNNIWMYLHWWWFAWVCFKWIVRSGVTVDKYQKCHQIQVRPKISKTVNLHSRIDYYFFRIECRVPENIVALMSNEH